MPNTIPSFALDLSFIEKDVDKIPDGTLCIVAIATAIAQLTPGSLARLAATVGAELEKRGIMNYGETN